MAVAILAIGPGEVLAQEPTAEQVARMMELGKPGPEHEELGRLAGEWDQRLRMWPAPGAEPIEMTGTSENRAILGGRFIESRSLASFGGEPMESMTILGFDRRYGEYTLIGLDTQGTYWVTAQGPRQASGSIVMSGTDDEVTVARTQVYDFVLRIESSDRYVIEIVFHDDAHTRGGGAFRMMEIVHTRRQS
jgi:hypothetical protein